MDYMSSLTKREYLAAKFLPALLMTLPIDEAVKEAFIMADAILEKAKTPNLEKDLKNSVDNTGCYMTKIC